MEKTRPGSAITFSLITFLGLISFILCIAADIKKTKKKDLKMDGKLCFLPGSRAFGLGIAALVCLFVAQIVGNLLVCTSLCCSREKNSSPKPKRGIILNIVLLILSWTSFGIAVVLVSAATSMNTEQRYGKGWLDGECYVVRDGVYVGSAILVVVAIGSVLVSALVSMKAGEDEQGRKVHAQV